MAPGFFSHENNRGNSKLLGSVAGRFSRKFQNWLPRACDGVSFGELEYAH
jgi:hypothetical protein